MQLTINKQVYELAEGTSLQQAIDEVSLKDTKGIAVALNEQIIPQQQWSTTILHPEDNIIIIGAVAGG